MPARMPLPHDFQALILCGPGVSFNTFTSTPEDFPKALIPVANRPMIWYPLDWCRRANITRITLITPTTSCKAIEDALSRNPHLTSPELPRPDVLAPSGLSQNTGTAEILRLPDVQTIITGHFLILPCDLLCDLPGERLLETWMIHAAGMVGSSAAAGGLGVWYPTKSELAVKGEETNFLTTAQLPHATVPSSPESLRPNLSEVVYSSTTDTLNDITESQKSFPVRHGLLRKHGKIRMLTTTRDAHIYLFPYWTLDFINQNPKFDSISEDVVGWWAKATWQDGLVPKLGLEQIFNPPSSQAKGNSDANQSHNEIDQDIDITSMSTTHISNLLTPPPTPQSPSSSTNTKSPKPKTAIPPFLCYLHPTSSSISSSSSSSPPQQQTLIRRVDTTPLLLTLSLHLASLASPSPLATKQKIHPTTTIAPRTTISASDVLIGANTTVNQFTTIKNSVVGANCVIGPNVRLTRCVIMDDVEVGERCQLTGCVVGWRSKVGKGCKLGEGSEVAPGYAVEEGVEGAGELLGGFEGLEEDVGSGEEEEEEDQDMEGDDTAADDA
ncbi:Translation initiation factor eIF-2B subunit gamma [Xanthoria parietina]